MYLIIISPYFGLVRYKVMERNMKLILGGERSFIKVVHYFL